VFGALDSSCRDPAVLINSLLFLPTTLWSDTAVRAVLWLFSKSVESPLKTHDRFPDVIRIQLE
jgi:hypothetical protein